MLRCFYVPPLTLCNSRVSLFILISLFNISQINSEVHVHWKGAAEMILASCTKYLDTDGQLQSIDGDEVRDSCYCYCSLFICSRNFMKYM